jgi:hypothetical protein
MQMKVRLAVLMLASAIFMASAPAQQLEVPSPLAQNAALQYWMAFSQLPAADKDHDRIYNELFTISVNDPAVERLLAGSHQSLLFLKRGGELKQCDWGLDYTDGVSLLLPHLSKSRDMGRLAALRIRHSFEHGNKSLARDDAMATMMLARHMGRDPIMICLLVRLGIEGFVIDAIAPYVPEIKASYTQSRAAFDALPAAATLLQTISTEKKYMAGWIITHLKQEEARRPGAWRDLWKGLLSGDDNAKIPASVKDVATIGEAIKMVEDLLPIYDQLSHYIALPNDQFDAQYPAFKEATKTAQPFAGVLLPAIDQLRAKEQRGQVRLELLLAGIAVAEGGPEKLKEIKDPFGTGPFEYKVLDKGFELKSKLNFEGQPVTLKIGR